MVIFATDEDGEFPSFCLPQVGPLCEERESDHPQEEEQTKLPTLTTSTLVSSSQAPTTLLPPDHHQHHHHHHNFWSAPGFYPFYDYGLLNPFGYDPFLTNSFLEEPWKNAIGLVSHLGPQVARSWPL